MDKKLDKALCAKYPNLFRNRNESPRKTCMCWGFTCGDGWYDIIDKLSAALEAKIVKMKEEGAENLPVAAQVKEKFGGLRFYMDYATKDMYNLIALAEAQSFATCEYCGAPGKLQGTGWVRTLCDDCNETRYK